MRARKQTPNMELSFVWKGRGTMQTTIDVAQRPPGASEVSSRRTTKPALIGGWVSHTWMTFLNAHTLTTPGPDAAELWWVGGCRVGGRYVCVGGVGGGCSQLWGHKCLCMIVIFRWSGRGMKTSSTQRLTPTSSSRPTIISSSERPGWRTRATTRVWQKTSSLAAKAPLPQWSCTVSDDSPSRSRQWDGNPEKWRMSCLL